MMELFELFEIFEIFELRKYKGCHEDFPDIYD